MGTIRLKAIRQRYVGEQKWCNPVRKNKNAQKVKDGENDPNVIFDAMREPLLFNGNTLDFDSEDPKAEALLQLSGQGDLRGDIWGVLKDGDPRQLYRVEKLDEIEKKMADDAEELAKYKGQLWALKDEEVKRYAVLLGIRGSIAAQKTAMDLQLNNINTAKSLINIMEMPAEERTLRVLISVCLEKGDAALKTGLNKRPTGIYWGADMWLGTDTESVMTNITEAKDRVELIQAMKMFADGKKEGDEKKKK